MTEDRTETNDLSGGEADRVRTMSAIYQAWANRCEVRPWAAQLVHGASYRHQSDALSMDFPAQFMCSHLVMRECHSLMTCYFSVFSQNNICALCVLGGEKHLYLARQERTSLICTTLWRSIALKLDRQTVRIGEIQPWGTYESTKYHFDPGRRYGIFRYRLFRLGNRHTQS